MENKKITEYTVAYGKSPELLTAFVKRNLAEGWIVYGNPFYGYNGELLCQAMIKSEVEKEVL